MPNTETFMEFVQNSTLQTLTNAQISMSQDLDGVVSSSLLRHEKGWQVTQFYNHEILAKNEYASDLPIVAVDCGVSSNPNEYSIDNHAGVYSEQSNINYHNAINLNLFLRITPSNYTDKFAMSTTLLTYDYLKKPLPPTDLGKMILIALDGGHAGYYKGFSEQFIRNLEHIGMKDELLPILEKHTLEDFENLLGDKLGAGFDKVHLLVDNTDLWVLEKMQDVYDFISEELGFPVGLPKGTFTIVEEYNKIVSEIKFDKDLSMFNDVKSLAFINRNKVSYSKKIHRGNRKAVV